MSMNDHDPRPLSPFPIVDAALRHDRLLRRREKYGELNNDPGNRYAGGVEVSAWTVFAGIIGLGLGVMAAGSTNGGGLAMLLSGIVCALVSMLAVMAVKFCVRGVLSLLKGVLSIGRSKG